MSTADRESPEDRLKRLAIETRQVRDLERRLAEYKENNKQRLAAGLNITPARQAEGEELRNELDEARQRLYYSLLTSISESSAHMEAATVSLQKSSEAQLKVAESQAKAIDDLLKSSRTIEQFSLFIIVLTVVNIFILEAVSGLLKGELGVVEAIADIALIALLVVIAYRWPKRLWSRGMSA
jgi:hypothetical protein